MDHQVPNFLKAGIEKNANGTLRAEWRIPENLFYFDGHFPNSPVLPAVAIVDLSVSFLESGTGPRTLSLQKIISAKMAKALHPGETVRIEAVAKGSSPEGEDWSVHWIDPKTLESSALIRLLVTGD